MNKEQAKSFVVILREQQCLAFCFFIRLLENKK